MHNGTTHAPKAMNQGLTMNTLYSGLLAHTRSSAHVALSSSKRRSFAERTTRLSSSLSDESEPTRNLRTAVRADGGHSTVLSGDA